MALQHDDEEHWATRTIASLAGGSLPPSLAKLYSQHTRLRARQPGLAYWRKNEATERLEDAISLLDAALVLKESDLPEWRDGARRAGEVLEWLSHPETNPDRAPLGLLAAAAYQLAGYPARAAGLLSERPSDEAESEILHALLRTQFPQLLRLLNRYWEQRNRSDDLDRSVHEQIVDATCRSLGVLAATMRWGRDDRLEKAIQKLVSASKVLLHSADPYSWLLARLCAEVTGVYGTTSLRQCLTKLLPTVDPTGKAALERYARQSYLADRAIAWPSQIRGFDRLETLKSFVLCTPTGSGKTTVAEVAILQALFLDSGEAVNDVDGLPSEMPLAIYLTPTRALAAEVEARLSRVLRRLSGDAHITVTGLYGGTDWGPTDAWLTRDERTVLICTYEKAEALVRFLGPLFLHRTTLFVVDEIHSVEYRSRNNSAISADDRSLRLESLGTRLLTLLEDSRSRVVALSAVASGARESLAQWVSADPTELPVVTDYRSTRQLIGRLICHPSGKFEIRYDLLDGASLKFSEGGDQYPYIEDPFPRLPPLGTWDEDGAEKKLRPHLYWAAMQLASPDASGAQRAVLISITQGIGGYAEDLLTLLEGDWANRDLPLFFQPPIDPASLATWQRCLDSCFDYFGETSREYRLLKRGIVVHHGNMPGLLARLLVEVIQQRLVNLVLATSTLSQGVNLPFETVLLPSLRRSNTSIDHREFVNLAGRAGRPGCGTEGRTLILIDGGTPGTSLAQWYYDSLIRRLLDQGSNHTTAKDANSPLAALLRSIERAWTARFPELSSADYYGWLESTVPATIESSSGESDTDEALIDALDSLDGILLPTIVEKELTDEQQSGVDEFELALKAVWQRTYAHYAAEEEQILGKAFVCRGKSIVSTIYPDSYQRRRMYRTSIPPKSASRLIMDYLSIREFLGRGYGYAAWSRSEQFEYVCSVVDRLTLIPIFGLEPKSGRTRIKWQDVLQWWLDPAHATKKPKVNQISVWHDYVAKNFNYRFNWALGSVVSLALDDVLHESIGTLSLDAWPQTQLPWIVFWLKELVVWGTLDPVAAFLIARGIETTRPAAEQTAREYYAEHTADVSECDPLSASDIRDWVLTRSQTTMSTIAGPPPRVFSVSLHRDFRQARQIEWRVTPVEQGNTITWLDPAGYELASGHRPEWWSRDYLDTHDFILNIKRGTVQSNRFL